MIIGTTSLDGTPLDQLRRWSRKKVRKQCDVCKKETIVSYMDIITSRNKRKTTEDRCFKCAMAAMRGENSPAKRSENKRKISAATRGKPKNFPQGINPKITRVKKTTNGYIQIYNDELREYELEHYKVIRERCNIDLRNDTRIVHHIDLNKTNNSIDNLFIINGPSDHTKIHKNLEQVAAGFIEAGLILFDKKTGTYYPNQLALLSLQEQEIDFDDIVLDRNLAACVSRHEVCTRSEVIRNLYLDVPLISSNMSTVTNVDLAVQMDKAGGLGILHRAYPNTEDYVSDTKKLAKVVMYPAVSIGVSQEDFKLAKRLVTAGAVILTIDIAHGHSPQMLEMLKKLRKEFKNNIMLIAGNFINPEALYDINDYINAAKIGIANGLACETKYTAGCNSKQLSTILRMHKIARKLALPIISDGGIRKGSDFVKAIAAGASAVMAGSIFARCPESAAPYVERDNKQMRLYAGMASRYVQDIWKGGVKHKTCTEGRVVYLEPGEPASDLVKRYAGALRSGISYAGATDCSSLREKVRFIRL